MPETSSPTLREWLQSRGGAAPFRIFMEDALYHPRFGYYARQIQSVGAGGDFSTSGTLGANVARAIASWIREEGEAFPELRHLIEVGAGTGKMHRDLREALGRSGRRQWISHLVETSSPLAALQRKTFRWQWGKIHWHQDLNSALNQCGGNALILSHELVDAFPVTLFQKVEGQWQEVWLELNAEGAVVETVRPVEAPWPGLDAADFPEGQRVEVHRSYREWLAGWRPLWKSGSMLTIDYGATAGELYHRQPGGTLRGYRSHQRLRGTALYRDPGKADLTADVNFTDLMEWGRELGIATVWLQSQAEFLAGRSQPADLPEERLASPAEAGGAFQCLMQRPIRK